MRSATCEEERIIARPPAFVGDLHQDRYKLASANRLGPARQPQLGFGREIALDCDAAADVWACSRSRFPSPSQRSLPTRSAMVGSRRIAPAQLMYIVPVSADLGGDLDLDDALI
jgi:hypothetical protein